MDHTARGTHRMRQTTGAERVQHLPPALRYGVASIESQHTGSRLDAVGEINGTHACTPRPPATHTHTYLSFYPSLRHSRSSAREFDVSSSPFYRTAFHDLQKYLVIERM